MDLAPGTQVTDNVQLVKPLGEGGMGSVWIAEHRSLHTRVAVKFIAKELLDEDPSIAERFAREASMSAQIKSPYVVQTFDHGLTPSGRPYIVMELLEGETLSDRLKRETILSLDVANLVVSQTAKALAKAHKLGIVHRDIKPDNLFMTWEEDELFVKVLDFGVAKRTNLPQADSVTSTGTMVGTPEYMSPEQVLSARSVDHRADLWALAVVAYRCLCGRVPFTGETLGALCVAIASGVFTPPSQHRPDLSPAVDQWFRRGLAVEEEERFRSARELAQSFSMALMGHVTEDFSGSGLRGAPDWSGAHAATSGANISIPPGPAGASPTFAGTTVTPREGKRTRLAMLSALVALSAGGAIAFFTLAAEEEPATRSTAAGDEPTASMATSAPEADAEPANLAPTASSSAVPAGPEPIANEGEGGGAPDPVPGGLPPAPPSPPVRPKPLAQPPSVAPTSTVVHENPPPAPTPTSTVKDRGF